MLILGRQVERRVPAKRLRLDVCATAHQHLHDLRVPSLDRQVQRAIAIAVHRVHVGSLG